jgi:broad specificity phosphatase PhoE
MNYQQKYLEYKKKYLDLVDNIKETNQTGGSKIKHIYIIRHGETEWNEKGIAQGAKNDIPLNHIGEEQAIKTGKYLSTVAHREHFDFDMIISSPMIRTIKTSELIGEEVNYEGEIITNKNLIENDGGLLNVGKTTEELKQDKFYDDYFNEVDREKKLDIIERNQITEFPKFFSDKYKIETLKSKRSRASKVKKMLEKIDKERIIVVSHNGFIDTFNKIVLNSNDIIKGDYSNGKNCHITYYQLTNKKWKLISAPNTLHMK